MRKDPDAGKLLRPEAKGTTEDKIAGWHHKLNGHELEKTPGDGGGQRSLGRYRPWDHKELDLETEQQNCSKRYLLKNKFKKLKG